MAGHSLLEWPRLSHESVLAYDDTKCHLNCNDGTSCMLLPDHPKGYLLQPRNHVCLEWQAANNYNKKAGMLLAFWADISFPTMGRRPDIQ